MPACRWCHGELEILQTFTKPPVGETDYRLSPYRRRVCRCTNCGHVTNEHNMPLSDLYVGTYVNSTYESGLTSEFERVMALAPAESDNRGRVDRVIELARRLGIDAPGSVLDVGSGLAVFIAAMSERGWRCSAVDPDPRAADHARKVGADPVYRGDFLGVEIESAFDIVTFNKVLEHVEDPVGMLRRALGNLQPGGFIYVEVPDGEAALSHPDGPCREEFFVEHRCAMSLASLAIVVRVAGLSPVRMERTVEPSGKFTIWAALTPAPT